MLHNISSPAVENLNKTNLEMVRKLAVSTIHKLAGDNEDLLFNPKTMNELEETNSMLFNIVGIKLKNHLLQN